MTTTIHETGATAVASATTASHPLDPLSAGEIALAARAVREARGLGPSARFVAIWLKEPPKDAVLAYRPGDTVPREAFVLIRERQERKTYEGVVSLAGGEGMLREWRALEGVQPPLTFEELMHVEEAVRRDERWREALRRRGGADVESAVVDLWPSGYTGPEDDPAHRRLMRPLTCLSHGPDDNFYAHPVENLVVTVDLDRMEVIDVQDHGIVPIPTREGNYTVEGMMRADNVPHYPGLRDDIKPISITQPAGPSFAVDGYGVSWQKWRFRIGFTPREGLVLNLLEYDDRGRRRPVMYRAALSEMWVPYGDPSPTQRLKNVFDAGEFGVGVLANSLVLGCDCLGEIRYFDVALHDQDGTPSVLKNAVCMHEEDAGLLWKHTDLRTGHVEVRRSRRLVVSSISTIDNYEYGFFWYLYQDGSIEYEIKLTGIITTGAIEPGQTPRFGTLVAPGLYGPHHQHLFNVRLDMSVDGETNSVYEVNSEALPWGPDNPHGNAWEPRETVLARESEAQRTVNAPTMRYWKVVNPGSVNKLGQAAAYKLMPGESPFPLFQPDALPMDRGGFARSHLWVTAYDPTELYATGDYPYQHPGGLGLPAYARRDRPLEGADVVVWYTFGTHHVVRPEDWPVMPVATCGFHLKPAGFFDGNPGLDVPPSDTEHCAHG